MYKKHGLSGTRLYRIWCGMRQRCYDQNSPNYKNYGGRGITVCDEWQEFEPFAAWALMHGYSIDLQIDRIDNDKGYSPENCRFVTPLENNHNRRNYPMSEEQKAYNRKRYMEWQGRKEPRQKGT